MIPERLQSAGPESLAAGALALSTTNTIAYSVFVGLSSATTTLVSQAVGAKDGQQVALWLYRAIIVHLSTAIPLTIILMCLAPILRAMGQDPELASAAGSFGLLLLPAVWAWGLIWVFVPWLQAQGVVRPQVAAAAVVAVLHPLFLWAFVHGMHGGMLGAAAANSLSLCSNLLLIALAAYACGPRIGIVPLRRPSRASLARLPTFLVLGLPGVLLMGEWWASEVNILLSGLLPSPHVALSSMSCYQATNGMCFMPAVGASVAGATRVGAALGAGDAPAARRAAACCIGIGAGFASAISVLLLCGRDLVAAAFTDDAEVRSLALTSCQHEQPAPSP